MGNLVRDGAGNSFQVMTFTSRSGNFSNLTGSTINEDLAFTGTATNTSYTLTARARKVVPSFSSSNRPS